MQPDVRLPRTTDLVACHVPSHRPVGKARRHPCAAAAVGGASLQMRPGVPPWLGATGVVHDLDLVRVRIGVSVRVIGLRRSRARVSVRVGLGVRLRVSRVKAGFGLRLELG